jgi:hypothetical protein
VVQEKKMNKTKKHLLLTLLMTLAAALPGALQAQPDSSSVQEEAGVSDEFIQYIKAAANPELHGMREDGRFYPYCSPQGRRIGYRLKVTDKSLYAKGWSVAEAEQALRDALASVTNDLRERMRREFECNFDQLPQASREMLMDFGFTEGVGAVRAEFIRAVLELDWGRILKPEFYVRYEADWPDSVRNKAFLERWRKMRPSWPQDT